MISIMGTDSKGTTRTLFSLERLVVFKQKQGHKKALFEMNSDFKISKPVKAKDKAEPDFFDHLDAQEKSIFEAINALSAENTD